MSHCNHDFREGHYCANCNTFDQDVAQEMAERIAHLESLCREVVEAREKIFNVGHDFKHGQIAELYLELHDKIDAMAEAIDKLRKEVG